MHSPLQAAELQQATNTPPIANSDYYTLTEDTGLIVPASQGVLRNDSDAENNALTVQIRTVPNQGTVDLQIDGSFVYTPDHNYAGSDTFTYIANDGEADSNEVSVHFTIIGENDAPTVDSQAITIEEDAPIDVVLNAQDADGDALLYSILRPPALGILIGSGDTVLYYPNDNIYGEDSYLAQVCEESATALCVNATISVTIVSVNDPPVVDDQSLATAEDIPLVIPLNAVDVENDPIHYNLLIPPALGTLSGSSDLLTYTPEANLSGFDSFVIEVCNEETHPTCDEGLIEVEIQAVNDVPVAVAQNVTVAEDGAMPIALQGSDIEGNVLTYMVASQPQHGLLSGSAPNLIYTPIANYSGSDSFTFRTNDGLFDSDPAVVAITVTPGNDAPVLTSQPINGDEDTTLKIALPSSDLDGDLLTYTLVTPPAHGTLGALKPTLVYTPNANYNGNDTFSLRASDGISLSNVATLTLTIHAVNDPPIAQAQNLTTDEDIALAVTVSGNDIDGDPLTYTLVDSPQHGSLNGALPNLTYTPDANFYGNDRLTFYTNDGSADSNLATVKFVINPVNDPPLADALMLTTPRNSERSITLTGSDIDGDSLDFTVVTSPTNGSLLGIAPNLIYTPTTDYTGTDSLTFSVCDPGLLCAQALVTVTVGITNTPPVAENGSLTTDENQAAGITLQTTDAENDTLTYSVLAQPAHGSLSGSAPNLTYTPDASYNGPDSFTFRANDGWDDSNLATVAITVTAVNDPPKANSQQVSMAEDTVRSITLTGSDPDSDSLTYHVLSQPTHGTLSGVAPDLTYTPNANFNGSDNFSFRVNDGQTNSKSAIVIIAISSINDAPVAVAQNQSLNEDSAIALTLSANDVDGDVLSYKVIEPPAHGQLSGSAPQLTYRPDANYHGSDQFVFVSNDGKLDSTPATVSLTVVAQNDAPVAQAQQRILNEDQPLTFTLSASDGDNDALTYIIVTQPQHGTLSGSAPSLRYAPNANYHGSDSFTFRTNDGKANSNVATLTFTIMAVNDAPTANSQNQTTQEDTKLTLTLSGSDIDQDTLTYVLVTTPAHGELTGSAPTFFYTPDVNYAGQDSFLFKTSDGHASSTLATVKINVTPLNDAPLAIPQTEFTLEDKVIAIPLSGHDPDGDKLTMRLVTTPTHGTLAGISLNPAPHSANLDVQDTLMITYTPALNFAGKDNFTYKVNDGKLDSQIVTIQIVLASVNDTPIANAQSVETEQEKPIVVLLSGSDVEDLALSYRVTRQPSHGTLSGILPNPTYKPEKDFSGDDSFEFKVTDSEGAFATATITIKVSPTHVTPEMRLPIYLPLLQR